MTIDEHQTKPAILDGLEEYLRYQAGERWGNRALKLEQWADEVAAITRAITQVGEEE